MGLDGSKYSLSHYVLRSLHVLGLLSEVLCAASFALIGPLGWQKDPVVLSRIAIGCGPSEAPSLRVGGDVYLGDRRSPMAVALLNTACFKWE